MTDECLFCKIAGEQMPVPLLFATDEVVAFRDINPQAPTHVLIVPRRHIATINEVAAEDCAVVGAMIHAARQIAEAEGIAEAGYRLVYNCNADGGQSVYHIHLHLLGGRRMSWPPG